LIVDAERFAAIRAGLPDTLTMESLGSLSDDIRPDGLPQNWVDDIENLTTEQRAILAGDIPNESPSWALALRDLLVAE
jgi:hypothetical protein